MRTLGVLAALIASAIAAAAIIIEMGWYSVSAAEQHLRPTFWLLQTTMRESVKAHASEVAVPPLDDPALALRGLSLYREHCARCHGAPGVAPAPFALSMTPAPVNLTHTALHWKPAELYWTTREGIKMTGMPAWKFRLPDDDVWAIVAFLQRLPHISPAAYAGLEARPAALSQQLEVQGYRVDPQRGRNAIGNYACSTCHRIPGIVGPNAAVGPPLEHIAKRKYLAGLLPNTLENMVLWLRYPQTVNPDSAMPDLGVTERDARDIASYLATLK